MTRLTRSAALLVLLAAGCVTALPDPSLRWDQAWKRQMDRLQADRTPEGARLRSEHAFWALTVHPGRLARLGLDPDQVAAQGVADALLAAKGMPNDPLVWRELEAWRKVPDGDLHAETIATLACQLADAQPKHEVAVETCGSFEALAGHPEDAVRHLKQALALSRVRDDQYRLVQEIEKATERPDGDLRDLSPSLILAANHWADQQAADQRLSAMEDRMSSRAAAACQGNCSAEKTSCDYDHFLDPFSPCGDAFRQCTASCGAYFR
ncbi:MAG: hypothetical protein ACYCWW_05160 [Deltaproteobacteria bacterium]